LQTPLNTGQNRTSDRFQTGRNKNDKETHRNHANFNEFLGVDIVRLSLDAYRKRVAAAQ
jgi:hypothetical protein